MNKGTGKRRTIPVYHPQKEKLLKTVVKIVMEIWIFFKCQGVNKLCKMLYGNTDFNAKE